MNDKDEVKRRGYMQSITMIHFLTFGGPTIEYHNCVNRLCNECSDFACFDKITDTISHWITNMMSNILQLLDKLETLLICVSIIPSDSAAFAINTHIIIFANVTIDYLSSFYLKYDQTSCRKNLYDNNN